MFDGFFYSVNLLVVSICLMGLNFLDVRSLPFKVRLVIKMMIVMTMVRMMVRMMMTIPDREQG